MARFQNPVSILHPTVAAARRDFVSGRITRREMLFRASMAGAGAMTLSALGGLKVAAQATPEGTPAATGELGYSIQVPSDIRTVGWVRSLHDGLSTAAGSQQDAGLPKSSGSHCARVQFVARRRAVAPGRVGRRKRSPEPRVRTGRSPGVI